MYDYNTLKVCNYVELNVKTLYLVIRLLTLNSHSSLLLNIGFVCYQEKNLYEKKLWKLVYSLSRSISIGY